MLSTLQDQGNASTTRKSEETTPEMASTASVKKA
jgi:hypothetical protein